MHESIEDGTRYINGTVSNIGKQELDSVTIIIKCYNTEDNKVYFTSNYQEHLKPGESRKISMNVRGFEDYDKFEVYGTEAIDY